MLGGFRGVCQWVSCWVDFEASGSRYYSGLLAIKALVDCNSRRAVKRRVLGGAEESLSGRWMWIARPEWCMVEEGCEVR